MRRILIALLAVAVLAAVAVAVVRREQRKARSARQDTMLLRFDERALSGFDLTTRGKAWSFRRQGSGWHLVAPFSDAVNVSTIELFLATARQAPVARVIEQPEALSDYGLDPPVASLRLLGVDAPQLDLGDAAPTGEGVFARVAGRPGVLVLAYPISEALRSPNPVALRDPSLAGIVASDMKAIEIESPRVHLRLEKGKQGWWIVAPRRLPASDMAVERLIGALDKTAVKRFGDELDAADPKLGLGPGSLRITLVGAGGTRSLRLGAAAGEGLRYAARDDREKPLAVDAAPLEGIDLDPRALEETRLTKINRYTVKRFAYRSGAAAFAAVREGKDNWKSAAGTPVHAEDVYGLLVRLLEAQTAGWDPGRGPSSAPSSTLDLELDGGGKERLEFWPDGRARVASLPDVIWRLASPLPPVPSAS